MTKQKIIGMEMLPLVERVLAVLTSEPSVVRQQMAIEMVLALQAARMGNLRDAKTVIGGVNKHALQLVEQCFETGGTIRWPIQPT